MSSAPAVSWMQWAGHIGIDVDSAWFCGLTIVTEDEKALLFGGGWDVSNDTWSGG